MDVSLFPRAPLDDIEREACEDWDVNVIPTCSAHRDDALCSRRPHTDGSDHVDGAGEDPERPIVARWKEPPCPASNPR